MLDTIYGSFNNFPRHKRINFSNNSNVFVQKYMEEHSVNKEEAKQKLGLIDGRYHFLFKDWYNIQIMLSYNSDSSLYNIMVSEYDTSIMAYSFKTSFLTASYEPSKKLANSNLIVNCNDFGLLTFTFSDKNLIESVRFYPKNDNILPQEYIFYDNFFCKGYGTLSGTLRNGLWKEYHNNGNLSSLGYYESYSSLGKNRSVKTGDWSYWNENGDLIKKECWEAGKLIKVLNVMDE